MILAYMYTRQESNLRKLRWKRSTLPFCHRCMKLFRYQFSNLRINIRSKFSKLCKFMMIQTQWYQILRNIVLSISINVLYLNTKIPTTDNAC